MSIQNKEHFVWIVVAYLDCASRKAVMELTQQHTVSHLVKFGLRVQIRAILNGSDSGEEFNISLRRNSDFRSSALVLVWVVYTPRCSSQCSTSHRTRWQETWTFLQTVKKKVSTVPPEWTRRIWPTLSDMPRSRRSLSKCCQVKPPPPFRLPNCSHVAISTGLMKTFL